MLLPSRILAETAPRRILRCNQRNARVLYAYIAAAVAVLLVVVAVAAWYGAEALVFRRIRALLSAANRVRGGDFSVRIGTTPGASDVLAPMALTDGLRLLPALGNAQAGTNAFVFNVAPGRDYYWSVQAVDTSFAGSPFAAEQQFTVAAPRIIEPLMLGNGHFQFSFSNEASVIYEVLATTNVALPLTQWDVLGLPTFLGGGLYRFRDTGAIGQPQRFYLLRAQ